MIFTRRDVAEIAAFLALFLALVAAAVLFHRSDSDRDLHSTWPESAEFSQLMGGQERFSEHATNAGGLTVVVDLCSSTESDRHRVDPCAPACERFERRRDGKR